MLIAALLGVSVFSLGTALVFTFVQFTVLRAVVGIFTGGLSAWVFSLHFDFFVKFLLKEGTQAIYCLIADAKRTTSVWILACNHKSWVVNAKWTHVLEIKFNRATISTPHCLSDQMRSSAALLHLYLSSSASIHRTDNSPHSNMLPKGVS